MALLSVADALAMVLADAAALPAEDASLLEACGRVLAADIVALRTQPPADVSAMDGYAVRGEDVTAATRVLPSSARSRPGVRSNARSDQAKPRGFSPAR